MSLKYSSSIGLLEEPKLEAMDSPIDYNNSIILI